MTALDFAAIEKTEARALRRGAHLSTFSALIWVAQAALIALAFERLSSGGGAEGVWAPAVGFVLLAVARQMLDARGQWIARRAAERAISRARAALAERMAQTSPFDLNAAPSGAVAALGGEKLETLGPYLTRYAAARLKATIAPLFLLIATAYVSWVAALVLLVAGPLIPLFMALVGMAAKEASERQMEEIGTLNGALLERLRGLVDIRLLDARATVGASFESAAERLRDKTMAVLRVAFLSSAVLELFSALGVAMVAVYVGFVLLEVLQFGAWGDGMTLGEGLFVLMLAPEFFQPLREFAAAWHDRAAAMAAAREFDAALADQEAPQILGAGALAAPFARAVSIELTDVAARGLHFPAHILITPGDCVALTGPSGSGKSTLLAMMAGLLRPDAGKIEVAGRLLDDQTADQWRARLAWVGQRPHFFTGSIRSAVAFHGEATDRASIDAALTLAAAQPIVERAPRGLDQRIGEDGAGVSGGEARRLAVARAAYARADMILADEPTADLDPETAEAVTAGLLRLAEEGAALVVATHDPRLIARMERRIELEAVQ